MFGDYALSIFLSLLFAGIAALITVYLSASTLIHSAKDVSATSLVTREDLHTEEKTPQQTQSKPMYFAAGSGIPEVGLINLLQRPVLR